VLAVATTAFAQDYDLVILNGRVMDPETMLDATLNVGVKDGRIVIITAADITGAETIDATGHVVAPGSSSASAEPARRWGVPFYGGMPAPGQAAPPAPRTDATDFDRFVAEVGVDASAIGGKNGRSPARAASSAPPTEHADSSDFERFVAAVGADAATIGDELERAGKLDPMGAELMAMIFCPMHLRMESRGAPLDPFDPFASVASQIDQRLIEVSQPASGRADKPDPSRQD